MWNVPKGSKIFYQTQGRRCVKAGKETAVPSSLAGSSRVEVAREERALAAVCFLSTYLVAQHVLCVFSSHLSFVRALVYIIYTYTFSVLYVRLSAQCASLFAVYINLPSSFFFFFFLGAK